MPEVKARFPKGIRKAIDTYREKIEAVVDGWVDWENPVGCGSFGCVFHIWTKDLSYDEPGSQALITDRVLKLSTDPTEGPVISAIMKTGLDKRLTGLARWYGVWRIPERIQAGSRGTVWVILREEVKPFDFMRDLGWGFGSFPKWMDLLKDYNRDAHKAIESKRPSRQEELRDRAYESLGQLYNYEETYFVADAIEQLGREDVVLADVHHGNLGFRIHGTDEQPLQTVQWFDGKERPPLLIFDPGHSSAPEGTEVQALFALSGTANSWIEGEKAEIPEL